MVFLTLTKAEATDGRMVFDQYLPRVKACFDAFPKEVRAIGDHTWNNGYNGIAGGEYYLRTGDKLPILQLYCDDAKTRQKFGWPRRLHPWNQAADHRHLPDAEPMRKAVSLSFCCATGADPRCQTQRVRKRGRGWPKVPVTGLPAGNSKGALAIVAPFQFRGLTTFKLCYESEFSRLSNATQTN